MKMEEEYRILTLIAQLEHMKKIKETSDSSLLLGLTDCTVSAIENILNYWQQVAQSTAYIGEMEKAFAKNSRKGR